MTMTLDPTDDRPPPRVANLAARTGHGSVYYAPEFWQHANAPTPSEGCTPGSAIPSPVRDAAGNPASSLVDRVAPVVGIGAGLLLAGAVYGLIVSLSRAVWR